MAATTEPVNEQPKEKYQPGSWEDLQTDVNLNVDPEEDSWDTDESDTE